MLTVSIHADPKVKFPHFTGFENEKGTGRGRNYNMNIPLPLGTGETEYSSSLQMALDAISRFKAEFIVVAFGADTHVNDPIGGFKLTTGYYRQMAKEIKSLNTPSMIVQEGGYNSSFLGEVIVSFLSGFY